MAEGAVVMAKPATIDGTKARRAHAHPARTQRQIADDRRAEEARIERETYGDGDLLRDIRYLRTKMPVNREGAMIRVGGTLRTEDEVRNIAARERRLERPEPAMMGVIAEAGTGRRAPASAGSSGAPARKPTETAAGLKVGQAVPLQPKAAPKVHQGTMPAAAEAPRKLSGAAAIAQEKAGRHSTDLGTKPRVVWLDLGLLVIDRRYQREMGAAGAAHVNRILREFNWNRYQPIVVSERDDGKYAVIDGQHRLEAARKHPLIAELPCYIIDAPDVASQASIFVAVNSRRLGLTGLQKFWAAVAAGDEDAAAVHALCAEAGITILRTTPSYDIPARSIYAAATVAKLVRQLGKPPIGAALKLLAETHATTLNAFRAPTIAGLARIAGGKGFSVARARAALKSLDLDRLYDDARRERIKGGGTLETATERVLRWKIEGDRT